MIIAVGSTNQVKVLAVEEVVKTYPYLDQSKIIPFSVPSEVREQPLTLEETILGAKNRAKNAFTKCDSCSFGVGIESGLCQAIGTRSGFLHVCACCIYDGAHNCTGLSTGFEVPPLILDLMISQKMDLSQASFLCGITDNLNIGAAEGLIGILTKGRMNRKEYTKQSVITAFIQLENHQWYTQKTNS